MAAGNQGFIAIGDWLKAYREELISLLKTEKARIPSYSTIRRVLLTLDYQKYSNWTVRSSRKINEFTRVSAPNAHQLSSGLTITERLSMQGF